jgi:hypothetical protein
MLASDAGLASRQILPGNGFRTGKRARLSRGPDTFGPVIGNRITFCECNHGVKKAGGFLHRLCIVECGYPLSHLRNSEPLGISGPGSYEGGSDGQVISGASTSAS